MLPISSSGHLIVVPWLMGWPDSGLAFDVALHLGTLAAVAFAFWRDWVRLLGAGVRGLAAGRPLADPDSRLLLYLALAPVPGAPHAAGVRAEPAAAPSPPDVERHGPLTRAALRARILAAEPAVLTLPKSPLRRAG